VKSGATAAAVARDGPPITQRPVEQEMAFTNDVPAGIVTEVHVLPASPVTISKPPAVASVMPAGLAPSATQLVAEAHETDRKIPVPPSTKRGDHDCPPSVLTRICAPTATQNVVVGQFTDPRAAIEVGRLGTVQDPPPSADTNTWPRYGPALPGETPTATHRVARGQLTPSNVVSGDGIVCAVQDWPPSLDVATLPCPTATQSDELAQSTASSWGRPVGSGETDQPEPPLVVHAATPCSDAFAPTATHVLALGQVMALNAPTPESAPPGVGTAGASISFAGIVHDPAVAVDRAVAVARGAAEEP